jgi:hypothetical protein
VRSTSNPISSPWKAYLSFRRNFYDPYHHQPMFTRL